MAKTEKKTAAEAEVREYTLDRQEGMGLGISPEEAVYRSVVDCVKDRNEQILELKMSKLRSIIDYKDSAQLLEQCEKKLKAVRREQAWKKLGRALVWVMDISLVVFLGIVILWVFQRPAVGYGNTLLIWGISFSAVLIFAVVALWLVFRSKRHR